MAPGFAHREITRRATRISTKICLLKPLMSPSISSGSSPIAKAMPLSFAPATRTPEYDDIQRRHIILAISINVDVRRWRWCRPAFSMRPANCLMVGHVVLRSDIQTSSRASHPRADTSAMISAFLFISALLFRQGDDFNRRHYSTFRHHGLLPSPLLLAHGACRHRLFPLRNLDVATKNAASRIWHSNADEARLAFLINLSIRRQESIIAAISGETLMRPYRAMSRPRAFYLRRAATTPMPHYASGFFDDNRKRRRRTINAR